MHDQARVWATMPHYYFLSPPEFELVVPACLLPVFPPLCPPLVGAELRSAAAIALDLKSWFLLLPSWWAPLISRVSVVTEFHLTALDWIRSAAALSMMISGVQNVDAFFLEIVDM